MSAITVSGPRSKEPDPVNTRVAHTWHVDTTSSQRRLGLLVVALLTVSAFGPYVFRGIRTDQFTVYVMAALLLPPIVARIRLRPCTAGLILSWSALVSIAVVGWIAPQTSDTTWGSGSALANLDNVALPLVCFVTVLAVASIADPAAMLHRAAALLVAAMCANSALEVVQIRFPLGTYLQHWWSTADNSHTTTAYRAITLGRYTGVLGQPALAGVLYGLALLCAIYLFQSKTLALAATALILTVGGVLTVSKAFLLIGLPIAAYLLVRTGGKRQRRLVAMAAVVVGLYAAAALGFFDRWDGIQRLLRLVPTLGPNQLQIYTGNRYGSASATAPLVDAVMSAHPIAGYGMPGLDTSTDAAWAQALMLAGILGCVALGLVLVSLATAGRHAWVILPDDDRRFWAATVTLLLVCSFGFPVFTGNRLAVVVWTFLGLLYASIARPSAKRPSAPTTGIRQPRLRGVGNAAITTRSRLFKGPE